MTCTISRCNENTLTWIYEEALENYQNETLASRVIAMMQRNQPVIVRGTVYNPPYRGVIYGEDQQVMIFKGYELATGDYYQICENCDELINIDVDDYIETSCGDFYCSDDCAHEADIEQCEYCGEWVNAYDAIIIDHEHIFCDDDCAERAGYTQCDDCGEWVEETTYINPYDQVCQDCLEDHYAYCEHCGEYVHQEDMATCDICEDCYEDSGHPELHQYGYRPFIECHGDTDGNTLPYLGVELETDSGDDRYSYVDDLASNCDTDLFWMTEDGSLCNGVEVTSQPLTLEHHIESGLWEQVCDIAKSNGFVSHDSGNCGLHVHINRAFFGKSATVQKVGGYKMLRLLQRFESQMTTFSRRTSNSWCSYKTPYNYDAKKATSYDQRDMSKHGLFVKANTASDNYAHSVAVNFQHGQTFELRIFRGTLKLTTLYATLAMAQGLARAAKSHGEQWVENVSWYDFAQWVVADCTNDEAKSALENYLTERELYPVADSPAAAC